MLEHIEYRTAQEKDIDTLQKLYHVAFEDLYKDTITSASSSQFSRVKLDQTFIAAIEDTIVGFSIYDFAKDDIQWKRTQNSQLRLAKGFRNKNIDLSLRKILKINEKIYGGEVTLQYFPESFEETSWNVQDNDAQLSAIFCLEKYRGNGIGATLTQIMLDSAKEKGIKKIYVQTIHQRPLQQIVLDRGFVPLLLAGPWYPNTQAGMTLGKKL